MGEGDMVCSAAFDRDDEFFATAGVSKRIKVSFSTYPCLMLLPFAMSCHLEILLGDQRSSCISSTEKNKGLLSSPAMETYHLDPGSVLQVFELASILDKDSMLHYPVLEMSVNSKISSLCWNSYVKSCLLAADYEGAIQLWDVSANAVTAQFEEHTKRVWSADFAKV